MKELPLWLIWAMLLGIVVALARIAHALDVLAGLAR